MKKLLVVVLIVVLLLVVVVGVLFASLNSVARQAVVTIGQRATRTPIAVESVSLSPFSGRGELVGLKVANPEGFAGENAFTLQRVFIQLEPRSLFSDELIINEVIVEGPAVFVEQSVRGNNINTIRRNVTEFAAVISTDTEEEIPDEAGKRVVVERLLVNDGQVALSSTLTRGRGVTVKFNPIELTDIGKGDQVATVGTVVAQVVDAITRAALEAAVQSGELLQQGRDFLLEGLQAPGEAAGQLLDRFQRTGRGLFGRDREQNEDETP